MVTLPGAARPARAPQMAWQTVDGELVLLNIDGKELLGVNGVGARIWELIDGHRSVDEIASAIAQEFAVDAKAAAADVRDYLSDLVAAGVIVVA